MTALYQKIAELGRSLGANKILLFGSRARGDHRERSDVDIAVFGMPPAAQPAFLEGMDALPTLLEFDVVFVTAKTSPELLENIKKDGVALMDKFTEKYNKLIDAEKRLEESLVDFEKTKLSSVRDGAIQRFEFCTELCWKSAREYLLNQGYQDINSPKSVMRTAFADGIITNESGWIALLDARNITSHIYDESTAAEVYEKISSDFLPLIKSLIHKLK